MGPAPSGPPVGTYRVPSLGWRILGGALRLIPLVVILVGVPVAVLTFLQSHGIALPLPITTVEYAGIALTILIVARYILKPTAAFGPLSIASAAVTIVYLYVILLDATYHLGIPGAGVTVSIGYGNLILLLLIVPALALGAGAVTLIEDVSAPKERLPFDYPP
ncbi:MAG: hypothetical protein L3J68_02105 [Thermoplasmata archaeon]|nr:hypothetical protein [Thermoplasmata archaeon]